MLSLVVFVGCSDDDPASPPNPTPTPDPAIGGTVGIYTDDAGTNRDIVDTGGTVTLYLIHKVTAGATASQFKIEAPAGWNLIGAVHDFDLHIGDFDDSIAYVYESCLTGTINIATLTYQSPGNSAGSTFKVLPDATHSSVHVIHCNATDWLRGDGLTSTVSAP
jgi:hypothetical protein